MMAASGWMGGHPEAGELLCFADRSMPAVEHERVAAHVGECELCQLELAAIEEQARSISAAMYSLDAEVVSDIRRARAWHAVAAAAKSVERRQRMRSVWLPRLAAAGLLLVVAGPGLALVRSLFERPAAPAVVTPLPADAPEVVPEIVRSITWGHAWSGAEFVLEFLSPPSGSLEFRAEPLSMARLQITSSAAVPRIDPQSRGVSIRNDSSAAGYLLSLPSSVSEVTVKAPGQRAVTLKPAPGMVLDLKSLSVRPPVADTPR